VAGLAVGVTPWRNVKTMMEPISTDDAFVNGHPYVARVGGQVNRVLVDDDDRVSKGDLLVQLDREPYQVQVDLKKAAVVNAEVDVDAARAQVRGILAQARSQRWKLQRAIEDVDDKVAQLKARVAARGAGRRPATHQGRLPAQQQLSTGRGPRGFDQRTTAVRAAGATVKGLAGPRRGVALGLGPHPRGRTSDVPAGLNQTFSGVSEALNALRA
jgi:membrane fusion protein (multidrug efflux system)